MSSRPVPIDEEEDDDDAPESTGGLDPKSFTTRILSCAKCHEPVATSAWSGTVTMRCGYCGHADTRELAVAQATEAGVSAYRDVRQAEAHARLGFALGAALDGMTVEHATPERSSPTRSDPSSGSACGSVAGGRSVSRSPAIRSAHACSSSRRSRP